MKTSILPPILMFLIFSGQAQDTFHKFDFGIEGGPNRSMIRSDQNVTQYYTPAICFTGGAFFQVDLSKVISIKTSLSFDRKVMMAKGDVMITDNDGKELGIGTFHSNYDYLVLPVLFRLTLGNKVRFFANAGPCLGYLLKAQSIAKVTKTGQIFENTITDAQKIEFGLIGGLGLLVPINKHFAISLEARDNFDLLLTQKEPGWNLKFNSIYLLFGFSYGI